MLKLVLGKRGLLLLTMVLCLGFVGAPTAQAFNLTITNNYDVSKSFALLYHDDVSGKWVCKGWYNVAAHTEKDYTFANSEKLRYAYVYSSAQNGEGQDDAIRRTVINEAFGYSDGQRCPEGTNRKTVAFAKFGMCINGAQLVWGESDKPLARSAAATNDEETAVKLLNQDRAKRGLAALKIDPRLTQVARAHAQDMVQNGFFDHVNQQGKSPFDRMHDNGISYRTAGENIAQNATVAALETAWMNSPKHRDNILSTSYTHVGVGLCKADDGTLYGVQVFASF